MYSADRLKEYRQQASSLPNTDLVGEEMLVINGSTYMLGTKADMDDIINAIMKVHENRDKLKEIKA